MPRLHVFVRSLLFRLLVIASVPFVALSVIVDQRLDEQRERQGHAEALVEVIDLRRAVLDVSAPSHMERLTLEAFGQVQELGIPMSLVSTMTGVDFEQMELENRDRFDHTLDVLADGFGDVELAGGATLRTELGPLRDDLDRHRAAIDAGEGDARGINEVFTRLDGLLSRTLEVEHHLDDHSTARPSETETLDHERMRALVEIIDTAAQRSTVLLDALMYVDSSDRAARLIEAEVRHDVALEHYRAQLEPEAVPAFDQVAALRDPITLTVAQQLAALDMTSLDAQLMIDATQRMIGHNDYLTALDTYSDGIHAAIGEQANASAREAERDLLRTWWMLLGIGGLTLALVIAGSVAVLLPLRRLTARAEAISTGNIDTAPLREAGSNDIRALTRTTNDMLGVLGRVEEHIHELAEGDLVDDHGIDLPGTLGASLRGSMRRLQAITAQLRRSEQLASAIVSGAADAIWTVSGDGTVLSANQASARLVGLPPHAQLGRRLDSFLSATFGEATITSTSSDTWPVLVSSSQIDSGDSTISVVIAHDISDRLDFERQLELQARRDPLTGMPNRLAVIENLSQITSSGDRAAVLYVDLDGFKSVNDLRGHATGDRVLAEVGRRLVEGVRPTDMVGRLGGDEFVVIAGETLDRPELAALGERLIRAVELPFDGDELINVSASVGIAILARQDNPEIVLSAADSALYQAKKSGKGRVEFFDRQLQEEVALQAELELELRRAIPNGELELHLQPILDLESGRIDGAEALVRWQRPGHGLVLPGDFIPIAERSSLIIEIDRWVIERCCERIVAWRQLARSADLRLAVNISGRHLMEGDLVADVTAAIGRTGADADMLEIELTETHLLDDVEHAIASLTALRDCGVRVAIDDFGSGYSAMNHLRQLPIDAIKIDRSYIVAATTNATDASVIDAVMAIGRSHRLEVVAEGIEHASHLEFMRDRGCTRAQGFLIARPLPIEEAERLIFEQTAVGAV